MNNVWYAVQIGNDYDWDTGSADYDKARAMAEEFATDPETINNNNEVRLVKVLTDDEGVGDCVEWQEIIRPGIDRRWVDIEVLPVATHSVYDSDCPVISGEVYSYTAADDAANAVIGVDRENGYRFFLHVGIDGIDVEARRADDRSLAGTLIKSNRKAVYYI